MLSQSTFSLRHFFPRRAASLRALLMGSALMMSGALAAPTFAQAQIDPTTTSSIGGAGSVIMQGAKGSGPFQNAIGALKAGNYADAYNAARGFSNDVERRAVQWAAIYFGKDDIDHQTILRFQADAPHFASDSTYKTRLEQAMLKRDLPYNEVIELLGGQMPNLVDAQIALADAYVRDGQVARAGRIIKHVWVNNFLDAGTEQDLYTRYKGQLTNADHWARANRLLMHDRARAVERIFNEYSPAQQSLLRAVIAVARKDNNSQTLLDRVDPQFRNHNLFHWANAEWAQAKGSNAGAVAHLNRAAGELPESHLWWYKRRYLARELLEAGDKQNAYLAAAGYTNGPEGRVVDAQFHAGWIALRFIGDAATAAKHFEKMASLSTLPSSVSESHYWWGRAYEAMGQIENARVKYQRAAKHDDYYYGQLASHKLNVQQLQLSPLPAWQDAEAGFNRRELVQAIRLFEGNKTYGFARPLLRRLIYQVKSPGEMLLTARLAQDIEAHDLAILMASISSNRGVDLDLFEFPKDGLPRNQLAAIDAAAVYAVARQESRFDRTAQSHSGALGLMQLMPGTAKETAGKLGLSYSKSRLTSDPSYNALLGSTYLKAQLERYDGSLVLAAAAYNAGAGNVNKWLKRFGDPRSGKIDVVDWIELIPFTETRGYVQKVLANYQVYRVRLGDNRLRLANYLMKID